MPRLRSAISLGTRRPAIATDGEPRQSLDREPWQSFERELRSHGVEPQPPLDREPWQSSEAERTRSRARTQTVYRERYWAPRRNALHQLERELRDLCSELGISASVSGRIKAFDSICRKIQIRQVAYQSIFDLAGIRVIVCNTADCYRLLDCVHRKYRPVPGHERDYIAQPKSNGYRSLHTTVLNSESIPVEIQVRTFEMDQQAVHGRAAVRSWVEGRVGPM